MHSIEHGHLRLQLTHWTSSLLTRLHCNMLGLFLDILPQVNAIASSMFDLMNFKSKCVVMSMGILDYC